MTTCLAGSTTSSTHQKTVEHIAIKEEAPLALVSQALGQAWCIDQSFLGSLLGRFQRRRCLLLFKALVKDVHETLWAGAMLQVLLCNLIKELAWHGLTRIFQSAFTWIYGSSSESGTCSASRHCLPRTWTTSSRACAKRNELRGLGYASLLFFSSGCCTKSLLIGDIGHPEPPDAAPLAQALANRPNTQYPGTSLLGRT